MPETGLQADARLARLARVDFPWMKIENARLPVDRVHALQAPPRHAVRQQSEVTAATRRQIAIEEMHGGHRQLKQPAGAFRIEGETWRIGHAVMIVAYRINAGAVR